MNQSTLFNSIILAVSVLFLGIYLSLESKTDHIAEVQVLQEYLQDKKSQVDKISSLDAAKKLSTTNTFFHLAQITINQDDTTKLVKSLPYEYSSLPFVFTNYKKQLEDGAIVFKVPLSDTRSRMIRHEIGINCCQSSALEFVDEVDFVDKDDQEFDKYFSPQQKNSATTFQNVLALFFLLGSFCCLAFSTYQYNERKPNRAWHLSVVLFLPMLIILFHSFGHPAFLQYQGNSVTSVTPLDTLLLSFSFLCFSSMFYHGDWFGSLMRSVKYKRVRQILFPISFLAFLLGLVAITYQMKEIAFHNILIDRVFFTKWSGLLLLCSFILTLFGIFIFQSKIYRLIIREFRSTSIRLGVMLIAMLLLAPFLSFLELPMVEGIAAATAYLLFFDLSAESPKLSITWLIWWFIMLGSFLTMVLYKNIDDVKETSILSNLKSSKYELDSSFLQKVQRYNKSIKKSDINKLGSLPFPSKIEPFDLQAYLEKNQIVLSSHGIHGELELILLDKYGNSLLNVPNQVISDFLTTYNHSEEIDLSTRFNPIYNAYVLSHSLESDSHPTSPFQLFFVIKPQVSQSMQTIAFYENGELIQPIPNFPIQIKDSSADNYKFVEFGNAYFVSKLSEQLHAATYIKSKNLLKPISLFSYIFALMGAISFLLFLINSSFPFLHKNIDFDFFRRSLKNRLQITIIFLIVFFFLLIIGVSSFYLFQLTKETEHNKLFVQLEQFDERILALMDKISINRVLYYSYELNELTEKDVDLIVYDQNRISTITSSKRIAQNGLRSLTSITNDRVHLVDLDGFDSKYTSAVKPISTEDGTIYLQAIKRNDGGHFAGLNDYLGSIINVYVFLFLIAGSIAIFIANSITYPISVVGDKLRNLKLGKANERLEYKGRDELGILINEYNDLLVKLEESAEFIVKSERDMAWREMAKQVAHEIKNPLTPMKLSIQYLEKALPTSDPKVKELVHRIALTLIEQIENLTQIANEFSSFAKLPQGQNEEVILNEVVEAVHDLFRKRDDMDIILHVPMEDVLVFADKNHLIRILNNLLKNAIQAIPEGRRGKINLSLTVEQNVAYIRVKDNGVGIKEEMKSKIFTPNFTTKSSGTGLGLAISANMLESFDGNITFESEFGVGSIFTIRIPTMRMDELKNKENRVYLEI